MPKKALPRIVTVSAGDRPHTLIIQWKDSSQSTVDVSGLINTFRAYMPLRQSWELFKQVRVGEYGTDIVYSDDLDMPADTLWRLAHEQSGRTITAEAFHNWRERKAYTLDQTAVALGISRRMVAYYDHGEKPIPRVVALATLALDPTLRSELSIDL